MAISTAVFVLVVVLFFSTSNNKKKDKAKKKRNGTSLWCGTVAVRFGARALVATLHSIAE
jgi:uncharacterized membrane protein